MTEVLDLALHGDAAACRRGAAELERQAMSLGDLEGELEHARTRALRQWQGSAGEAFRLFVGGVHEETVELKRKSRLLADALGAFAAALDGVAADLAHARDIAHTNRLTVQGDHIHAPLVSHLAVAGTPGLIGPRITAGDPWQTCGLIVADARERERRAHEQFQAATEHALRAPFLERWLKKCDIVPEQGALGVGAWAGKSVLNAAGVTAAWRATVTHGGFRPIGNAGPINVGSLNAGQRFRYGWSSKNYAALSQHHDEAYASWTKTGTKLNAAGAVVAGGLAGVNQWQADSDVPNMGDGEQLGRAVTVGSTTAIGAYGGAVLGGKLGGAIGTAICPGPGTVIGAAIGGIVVGAAFSEIGTKVGQELIEGPKNLISKPESVDAPERGSSDDLGKLELRQAVVGRLVWASFST